MKKNVIKPKDLQQGQKKVYNIAPGADIDLDGISFKKDLISRIEITLASDEEYLFISIYMGNLFIACKLTKNEISITEHGERLIFITTS
ncbi:hypothetical protein [Hathewaya massiliensis]|uniref:hypothetical protein n=1 Tax=Hathewaya massiliensis TaxID=1964382 RepID=UPI00115A3AA6|nr:hypothetical protein [Hathewaya massiliensis]